MDNITKLWIRACKSMDKETRVNSVYRRFYFYSVGEERDIAITMILSSIVDKYCNVKMANLLSMLGPNHYIYGGQPYYQQSREVMIELIRRLEVSKIEGWVSPVRWRRGL